MSHSRTKVQKTDDKAAIAITISGQSDFRKLGAARTVSGQLKGSLIDTILVPTVTL